jgi:hypothetical protein
MKKEKKKKKKKAMLVLMLYILLGSTCTHIIWKSKEPLVLGSLEEIPQEPAVLRKGQGVREPAFSVAVIDYMSETDLRFLRSAAVIM